MKITSAYYFISILVALTCVLGFQSCHSQSTKSTDPRWPSITRETKPWSRWWWHGNAVTKAGITAEMEAHQKAGLGGLEITPIYGVVGYEDKFINFLAPQWTDLLVHTLREAERLGMGIDMATGTGWPFGGPWVGEADACKNIAYKIYEVKGGTRLTGKVTFVQQPLLRAIGNRTYESTAGEPVMRLDPRNIDIKKIAQPISANNNLQLLAIDQIKFEKPLALKALMAYGQANEIVDLKDRVDVDGTLQWVAPPGDWKLYALFEGWHGKMVERAGPGGEGNVIDHFSVNALSHYLHRFDSAFQGSDIGPLRAFFNDSYEVDDARGVADWTPSLLEDFKRLKGYDLKDHLPALFGNDNEEKNRRVLSDYRETMSELLLKNFTEPWKSWAHGHAAIVRNQAHGSPSNILDLYATVDIPEIEGIEPLRIKMASSAGNVTGKRLVSSESATWLNEHFQSNLGEIKIAVDRFFLNGVNHIFYHGTCYSPIEEAWPGWLFYAAVHLNPRNPQWTDFAALNDYVSRMQSFLQSTSPDNDILLYYPIYDRFAAPGPELLEHFDGIGKQFANTAFERAAEKMSRAGYTYDYISDKQIQNTSYVNGSLQTSGASSYKTLILPHCGFIPLPTLRKIISLAEAGATVIILEGMPASFAGYSNFEENKREFEKLMSRLPQGNSAKVPIVDIKLGKGRVLVGDDVDALLQRAAVRRETFVDQGIQFIRKKGRDNRTIYLIANTKDESFDGWLPLATEFREVVLYDPMTGRSGIAGLRRKDRLEVHVVLAPHGTVIMETSMGKRTGERFLYHVSAGSPIVLKGKWEITFISGGSKIPPAFQTDTLFSWTRFGSSDYPSFSGTASYKTTFNRPKVKAAGWLLDLGKVRESAQVIVNGRNLGTLIGPAYRIYVDAGDLRETNVLEVKVSNLMANRIADMDQRGINWKKFYNVNMEARRPEDRKNGLFNASAWPPRDSGLLGPVRLTPLIH